MPQQHAKDQQPVLTNTLSLAHHDVQSRAESISAKVRAVPTTIKAKSQHLMRQHARAQCQPARVRHRMVPVRAVVGPHLLCQARFPLNLPDALT